MADNFFIGPIQSGLIKGVPPFLLPEDAFAKMDNAYIYRGRVRKRFGTTLMNNTVAYEYQQYLSRLRIKVGTTNAGGDLSGTVPGTIFKLGQAFTIDIAMYSVYQLGVPADMLATAVTTTHTFNTTTGAFVITGSFGLTDVYFYPSTEVMHITQFENFLTNQETSVAFDREFAYTYTINGWERLVTGTALWTSTDYDFHSTCNYRGTTADQTLLFVVNYNITDQIKYFDGTTWATMNPAFLPTGGPGLENTIESAKIVLPFKDRLLLFNTREKVGGLDKIFVNRIRWSQNGTPIVAADATAWYEPAGKAGKGNYLEADTQEAIISVKRLKDKLIVFFESSTWELSYVEDQVLPFRFKKINNEMGVESMNSTISFDDTILGIGENGINSCNGQSIQRIDYKIMDDVFNIYNADHALEKICGIRDYYNDMVYWALTLHSDDESPNKLLVYNPGLGTWSYFDESCTAFGYYHVLTNEDTWQNDYVPWEEDNTTWNSGKEIQGFKDIICGNSQGYMRVIDANITRNSPSLQISNIYTVADTQFITVFNHGLSADDFILIEHCSGITTINDLIFQVIVIDDDTLTLDESPIFAGTYTGLGTIATVSRIDILTKQFNFYEKKGKNMYLSTVDFHVDKTAYGSVTVDSSPNTSSLLLAEGGLLNGVNPGLYNALETFPYPSVPLEGYAKQLWHKVYFQSEGEYVQLRIFLNDADMFLPNIVFSDFQLHGMLLTVSPTFNI